MARTEDSHLAKSAEAAQLAAPVGQFDPVELAIPEPVVSIPVRDEPPAQAVARSLRLSAANPVLLLLPQDPRRRRAIVLPVDNDIYVTSSKELAQAAQGGSTSPEGFYLPKGVPAVITTRGVLWAAITTVQSGTGQVSSSAAGSVTNPGSFTAIAGTTNLTAGTYSVTATVFLSGTVTTADANNMFIGGSSIPAVNIAYPGVANVPATITAVVQAAGGDSLRVITTNAASGAAAVYNAGIVVTPVAPSGNAATSRVSVLVEKDDE